MNLPDDETLKALAEATAELLEERHSAHWACGERAGAQLSYIDLSDDDCDILEWLTEARRRLQHGS